MFQHVKVLLLAFIWFSFLSFVVLAHNRPVIGVLAQPTDGDLQQYGASYIAASYVKFVEGAGGRVAPIDYRWPADKLKKSFMSVNGLLFPGVLLV